VFDGYRPISTDIDVIGIWIEARIRIWGVETGSGLLGGNHGNGHQVKFETHFRRSHLRIPPLSSSGERPPGFAMSDK